MPKHQKFLFFVTKMRGKPTVSIVGVSDGRTDLVAPT